MDYISLMCVEQFDGHSHCVGSIHASQDFRHPKEFLISGCLEIFDEDILLNPTNTIILYDIHELQDIMLEYALDYAYILRRVAGSNIRTWSILRRTSPFNFYLESFPEYMAKKGWIDFDDDEASLEVT